MAPRIATALLLATTIASALVPAPVSRSALAVRTPGPTTAARATTARASVTGDALLTLKQLCFLRGEARPDPASSVSALAIVTEAGSSDPGQTTPAELGNALAARKWRGVFSATWGSPTYAKSLLQPRAEYVYQHRPVRAPDGSVSDGSFETTIFYLFGLIRVGFLGNYRLGQGGLMNLQLETLQLRLWSLTVLSIGIAKGLVRALIDRVRGGRKGRPNLFYWHYADATICAASGTSGRTALWGAC